LQAPANRPQTKGLQKSCKPAKYSENILI